MRRRNDSARHEGRVFRSLTVPNYRRYFWGSFVSNIGVWMQRTAQVWVVMQLSGGNGVALGVVAFLQFAPTLVFGLYAGLVGDRFSRAKILLVTQCAISVVSAIMAVLDFAGLMSLPIMYVLAAVVGIVTAFDAPIRQTFVSDLVVDPEFIGNAVGLNSAAFNSARLIGPAVAGGIMAVTATWTVFALHVVASLGIIASLYSIGRSVPGGGRVPREKGQLREGIRYVLSSTDLVGLLLIAGVISALGLNGIQVFIPLASGELFGRGALAFGMLTSAMAIGSVIGALVSNLRSGMPKRRTVFCAAAAAGICECVLGVMPTYELFAVMLLPTGIALMYFVVAVNTRVQMSSADWVRGRVMSLYMMVFFTGAALGSTATGGLSELLGIPLAVATAGASMIACALLVGAALLVRARRHDSRETDDVQSNTDSIGASKITVTVSLRAKSRV